MRCVASSQDKAVTARVKQVFVLVSHTGDGWGFRYPRPAGSALLVAGTSLCASLVMYSPRSVLDVRDHIRSPVWSWVVVLGSLDSPN